VLPPPGPPPQEATRGLAPPATPPPTALAPRGRGSTTTRVTPTTALSPSKETTLGSTARETQGVGAITTPLATTLSMGTEPTATGAGITRRAGLGVTEGSEGEGVVWAHAAGSGALFEGAWGGVGRQAPLWGFTTGPRGITLREGTTALGAATRPPTASTELGGTTPRAPGGHTAGVTR